MENRKKIAVPLAIGLLVVLLGSFVASVALGGDRSAPSSPQESKKLGAPPVLGAPPNKIPGFNFTGTYIRIGINKGGTFGVGNMDPGCGFQFPIGDLYESLAIWWWGEGYSVHYKTWNATVGKWQDKHAFWWPSLGWPPPASSNILPVSSAVTRNDTNKAIVTVVVQTADRALTLEFKFNFLKDQKYVWLQTKITSNVAVQDVVYKRIVDWDIHHVTYNAWTSDSHSAYASYYDYYEDATFEMSVSGYTAPVAVQGNLPVYVDLNAWDDYYKRDPGYADIQSHNNKLAFDGNAAIYYDLGNMPVGVSRTVYTVYQAGWNWYSPPPPPPGSPEP